MLQLRHGRVRLHRRGLNATLNARRSGVYRMIRSDTVQARRVAKRFVHRRSGELRKSINSEMVVRPFVYVMGRVYSPVRYALWVEVGTSSPITPKRAGYLRFPSTRRRDFGQWYSKRSVSGQPGQRYLTLGLLEGVRGRNYDIDIEIGNVPFSGRGIFLL